MSSSSITDRKLTFVLACLGVIATAAISAEDGDTARAAAILGTYCIGCHNPDELDGDLDLTTGEAIQRGNDDGPVIVPGVADQSKLVLVVEHKLKPFMPPKKQKRPTAEEIAVLRRWVEAGAPGLATLEAGATTIVTPRIEPRVPPRRAASAVACSRDGRLIAVGAYRQVRVLSAGTRTTVRTVEGITGRVNAIAFSRDGSLLACGAGEPGVGGEVTLVAVAGPDDVGAGPRTLRGHRDSIHALALSDDGRLLATGSYDRTIGLWSIESGELLRTLDGHNGAVFDVAFRPDGALLASASADRTVKIWNVSTGERLDTFSQSLKEIHALAFSPDGGRLAAGGEDRRIRVWEVSPSGAEGTSPLLHSRFAHEGAILDIAYSPDGQTMVSTARDGTVKLWDARAVAERTILEAQPDWPVAVAFTPDGRSFVVARLDGSLGFYDANGGREVRIARARRGATGGALIAFPVAEEPAKPEIASIEPRGLERGATTRVRVRGKHLGGLRSARLHLDGSEARPVDTADAAGDGGSTWIEVTVPANADPGAHELSVTSAGGESNRVRLHVDTVPQTIETEPNDRAADARAMPLPVSFWGALGAAGDVDHVAFEAEAGATVVLDAAARRLGGSKANLILAVLDERGRVLGTRNDFGADLDPLLAFTAPASGRYVVRVADLELGGSGDHFYRLSIGAFPFATGCFPLAVPAGVESAVELVGHNLDAAGATVRIAAPDSGEVGVPIDGARVRTRGPLTVRVAGGSLRNEIEPNDTPGAANVLVIPGSVNGRLHDPRGEREDVDVFRFTARANEEWVIETEAARRGSPADTRIDVLHPDGRTVERVLLQAVRDSEITFRPIDSVASDVRVTNWEEMDLDQYLYFQGEVSRIIRMPQGPDSGFKLYQAPNGQRRCFFDTSATAHANHEPCYVVEPHPPGARLVPTGLPVFTLGYSNDDDGMRELGKDSRLTFRAPADGDYLVRVRDARGFGGPGFAYRLIVRPPSPGFRASIGGRDPTVEAGSGRQFTCRVQRVDGFEGPVRFDVTGMPPGFSVSTPVVIEAGHLQAEGTINAAPGAPKPAESDWSAVRVTATATIGGESIVQEIGNLGKITLGDAPKLFVELLPLAGEASEPGRPAEVVIRPGERARAVLRIRRNGHDDRVTFDVDNLPYGVIVDDIGLNGVLIPPGESERTIFLHCSKWVPETDRLFFARSREAGGQTSLPLVLHVRR